MPPKPVNEGKVRSAKQWTAKEEEIFWKQIAPKGPRYKVDGPRKKGGWEPLVAEFNQLLKANGIDHERTQASLGEIMLKLSGWLSVGPH